MPLTPRQFQKKLLAWFDQHGRKHLPWQQNKTPYRVWISEIMLQQTQVNTVIPYYEKFMQRFPDLATLAHAPLDAVLHAWAGLGYYSRAHHLHRAAHKVMETYGGDFPHTLAEIQTLPGIGPSTAGAIAALALNQQATILDGNVKRVLARFYGIQEPVDEKTTEKMLWEYATRLTPKQRTADYTQAMMDLGATCCTRTHPTCPHCPLQRDCMAYRDGIVADLPRKKATKTLPTRIATFLILKQDQAVLLQKRPATGIWKGLWSVPEISGHPESARIEAYCQQHFRLKVRHAEALPSFRHTFSHYHLQIHPILIPLHPRKKLEAAHQIWYNPRKPSSVGLPKPIHTLLRGLP